MCHVRGNKKGGPKAAFFVHRQKIGAQASTFTL